MFGVMVTFKFKEPLIQEQIDSINEKVIEPMTHDPGFRQYFVVADEAGTVGTFHVWESKEQAEAAIANLLPRLQPLIADLLEEPSSRIMSDVLITYDSRIPAGDAKL